jgi:low temperature requirement protein LtrA
MIAPMATVTAPPAAGTEQKVTPLELFFDLVFVFAITQVTSMLARDPTWAGLGRGLLVLANLWWAWAAFSWLTNTIDAEEGVTRLAMIAASTAALIASLAVPGAFGPDALVFGLAYTSVRVLHVVLFILATPDREVRIAIERMAPGFLVSSGLIVAAAAFHGAARTSLWCLALVVHVGGLWLTGVRGWKVYAGHFAERHGLIVIIALGESIVSVGVGAAGHRVDAPIIATAVLGIALAASIWWSYFDVAAIVAERRLRRAEGDERARIARDSYTYLHLPMVAGIVLLALGIKKTAPHTGEALAAMPAFCLCGGVALYLLAHVAFRLRNVRTLSRRRLVAAAVCLALFPLATAVPALLALALVTGVLCTLIAYESIRYAGARQRVRQATD